MGLWKRWLVFSALTGSGHQLGAKVRPLLLQQRRSTPAGSAILQQRLNWTPDLPAFHLAPVSYSRTSGFTASTNSHINKRIDN